MLPDLPNLKRDIQQALDRYIERRVHSQLGAFSRAPRHVLHEGDRMRTIREDGSTEESSLKEASGELWLKTDEIPRLTLDERIQKLNGIADDIARQAHAYLYANLNTALEKAGQAVSQQGKPLDTEAIFKALENIQIEFDENRNPAELSIEAPPTLLPRFKGILEQIEKDPALRKRYQEILERKWLDWRDREAARKLVG